MIARALGVALAASIVAFCVQTWRLDSAVDALHEQERMAAAELIAAEQRARQTEQQWADNARKAAQTYAQQTSRVRADAASARTELDSLRDTLSSGIAQAPGDPASAARADVANRLAAVVNECAAALSTVAADADATAAKLIGLQAYVSGLTKD